MAPAAGTPHPGAAAAHPGDDGATTPRREDDGATTPREDEPTAEQHAEVAMLLREEQLVYDEIVARFERQIAARNATSRTPRTREAGSMERDMTQ